MSIQKLREVINEAYELSKGLDHSSDEMDERKRALVDDLRSAQFALDMYEESTFIMSRVYVDVDLMTSVIVKHRHDQDPEDAAIQYVSDVITVDCDNCYVEIDNFRTTQSDVLKIHKSEDLDITEDE